MRVPDAIKKCVVFVGYKEIDGTEHLAGTALHFGDSAAKPRYSCFVTARHVIHKIRDKTSVEEVWLRVNAKSTGREWVSTELSKWICHPRSDVAIHFGALSEDADHMILDRTWAVT